MAEIRRQATVHMLNSQADKAPAPAGNRPGVWPHLSERSDMTNASAPAWTPPECGEDEDYVEYLGRASDYYCANPPPAGEHLALVECDANPRHWPMYEVKTDDFYPAPCQYCMYDALREELNQKERQTHWLDHPIRGKLARRMCGWAYEMGIIASYGSRWGGPAGCRSCITGIRFKGRRPYILGRRRGDA